MAFTKYFIVIFVFSLVCINQSNSQSFLTYKQQMQNIVKTIASEMQDHYKNWCSPLKRRATCETLSYNGCLGVNTKSCDDAFPRPAACLNEGQSVSKSSALRFPQGFDYNNLQAQDIRFICSSAKLQNTFKRLASSRNKRFTNMYIGSSRGLFRRFPGRYSASDGICDEYDPRYRPWYTIAASGSKNVLILLDKSGSMYKSGYLAHAKIAVDSTLGTLSISDNVGVVAFENETTVLGNVGDKLISASDGNVKKLRASVKNIVSNGGQTNYWQAFKKGLAMLNKTIAEGDSGCSQAENVFLLITDGNPTYLIDQAQQLVDKIKQFMSNKNSSLKRIILFVYALGKVHNIQYLKTLTCNFRGQVITSKNQSLSSSAVVTQLHQYYKYLSVGVHMNKPIWTQPYIDYYSYVKLVTVSMAAYYTNEYNMNGLIGIAGVDIIMDQFYNYGYSESDVLILLIGESACQRNRISDCQLQALRADLNYQCDNVVNCMDLGGADSNACLEIPNSNDIWIYQNMTNNTVRCCGIEKTLFAIIVSVSLAMAIIVAILVWQRKRIYHRFCDRSFKKISTHDSMRKNSRDKTQEDSKQSRRKLSQESQKALKINT